MAPRTILWQGRYQVSSPEAAPPPSVSCCSGRALCALKHTHSLSRANSACSACFAHPCSLHRCISLGSTGPPRPLAVQDIPVYRCPVIRRTGPIGGSRERFGLLISQIRPLRGCHFTHACAYPGGYIFCGGIVGSSLRKGSKDWPSR